MGEGKTPPEGVGGVLGYEEFLYIINRPGSGEYESACQWAESQGYKEFDIDLLNRRLKYALLSTY